MASGLKWEGFLVRRDWTKDYEERLDRDGRSSYVYKGTRYALTPEGGRAYRTRVLPPLALVMAALAVMGLMDTPGAREMYVALPYALVFFPAALGLFDLVRILLTRRALTARDYGSSALRLQKSASWLAALAALAAACDLLYLILNGWNLKEGAFFALALLNLILSILVTRGERAVVWDAIPHASDPE